MFYDVSFLWVWLLFALLIGAAMGWRTEAPEPQAPLFAGGFRIAVIALAVAFVIALLDLLPGRLGFWWESGVLFLIAYLAGCFAGGAAHRARDAASTGFARGRPWPLASVFEVARGHAEGHGTADAHAAAGGRRETGLAVDLAGARLRRVVLGVAQARRQFRRVGAERDQ
jgi:hypothetical protein